MEVQPGVLCKRAGPDIYFDFNPPVRTPDATVVLGIPTGVHQLVAEEVLAYPVPVSGPLTVVLPPDFEVRSMMLTTLDGRRMSFPSNVEFAGRLQMPTQQLPAGAYMLTMENTDGRRAYVRFVKE